ncbi:hypothetical protein JTE90_009297, partial [Oedothorax gibbosus]
DNVRRQRQNPVPGTSDTIFSSFRMAPEADVPPPRMSSKRFNHEVMEVAGKDGRVRYEERNKFPYTFAVVMESQRKSRIVPRAPHGGSEIVANLWGLHSDPKYWENPEEFRHRKILTDGGTKLIRYPPSFASVFYW